MTEWARTHEDDSGCYIESRGGVPWFDAPLPRRLHRCDPQTRGCADDGVVVERCACGATRLLGRRGPWIGKNETRKGPRSRLTLARRTLAFHAGMCALGVLGVVVNIFAWHSWLSGALSVPLVVLAGGSAFYWRRRVRALRQAPSIEMLS